MPDWDQPVGITIELIREKLEQYFQVNQLQTFVNSDYLTDALEVAIAITPYTCMPRLRKL